MRGTYNKLKASQNYSPKAEQKIELHGTLKSNRVQNNSSLGRLCMNLMPVPTSGFVSKVKSKVWRHGGKRLGIERGVQCGEAAFSMCSTSWLTRKGSPEAAPRRFLPSKILLPAAIDNSGAKRGRKAGCQQLSFNILIGHRQRLPRTCDRELDEVLGEGKW